MIRYTFTLKRSRYYLFLFSILASGSYLCQQKAITSPIINRFFSYGGCYDLKLTNIGYSHLHDIKNYGEIRDGNFYFAIQSDKHSSYKVLVLNLRTLHLDTLNLSNIGYKGPDSSSGSFTGQDFKYSSSMSTSPGMICILFNRAGRNENFLYIYTKTGRKQFSLNHVEKLNDPFEQVKLVNDKILLSTCYYYHPSDRKIRTELLLINPKRKTRRWNHPAITHVESSLFMPFFNVDASDDFIIWGNPDKYQFSVYNSHNLDSITTYQLTYDNWKSTDTIILYGLRKRGAVHPRLLIDTLQKISGRTGKMEYYKFLNTKEMIVAYMMYDSISGTKKNYFDIWKFHHDSAKVTTRKAELKSFEKAEKISVNNFPMTMDKDLFFTGENYLVIIGLETPLPFLGKKYETALADNEKYFQENDPVLKLSVYRYNP